jgi:hypothetical protein
MKISKILFICLAFFAVTAFSIGVNVKKASAASDPPWYDCTVERAGAEWIELTDSNGAFEHKWFLLPSNAKNQGLAMGLTCISNTLLIHANISDPANYLSLLELYVLKP